MNEDIAKWLGGKKAGRFIGYSWDWIEVRATPWQKEPVPGRIRFKVMRGAGDRKYYVPDIEAFLAPA